MNEKINGAAAVNTAALQIVSGPFDDRHRSGSPTFVSQAQIDHSAAHGAQLFRRSAGQLVVGSTVFIMAHADFPQGNAAA